MTAKKKEIAPPPAPREFCCFVPIEPFAKERPEFIIVKDKATGRMRGGAKTRENTEEYETILKKEFMAVWGRKTDPIDGSLYAETWYYVTRPKGTPKKKEFPDTKPDADNLDKAALDSLEFTFKGTKIGAVIENDSRIVSKVTHKRYADTHSPTGQQGVFVLVGQLTPEHPFAQAKQSRLAPEQEGTPREVIVTKRERKRAGMLSEAADRRKASPAGPDKKPLCVVLPAGRGPEFLSEAALRAVTGDYEPSLVSGLMVGSARRRLILEASAVPATTYCLIRTAEADNDLRDYVQSLASQLGQRVGTLTLGSRR